MSSFAVTVIPMVASVVAVAGHWFLTGRLFPRSVSLNVIRKVAQLNEEKWEVGVAPVTKFYEWNQDRWRGLAKGAGGAAITPLASIVGLLITAAGSTTATADSEAEGVTTTVTTAAAEAAPELIVLIVLFLFVALLAWLRAARVHLDFAEDLSTLADSGGAIQ